MSKYPIPSDKDRQDLQKEANNPYFGQISLMLLPMTAIKKLLGSIWGLFDRLLCVAFAFAFSLIPAFIQQYQDTLGEVRDRAQDTYVALDAKAAQFNLDVDSYLDRQDLIPDSLREINPQLMQDAVNRYRAYDTSFRTLAAAPNWKKPFTFLSEFNKTIRSSLDFKPIVSVNWVGAFYAFLGVLFALGLLGLVEGIATRLNKRFTKPKPVYDPYKYRKKDQG